METQKVTQMNTKNTKPTTGAGLVITQDGRLTPESVVGRVNYNGETKSLKVIMSPGRALTRAEIFETFGSAIVLPETQEVTKGATEPRYREFTIVGFNFTPAKVQ